ncbi:hypothetical protein DV515_00016446 [Chloebia gouldiae]|uniref:Ig-like domain-containing protein n=1 Tax=Chloebia gouldiae TaxID=44316 RepID=A0A3L8RTU9_CHLGU|nr:hypothetical protein DV515_00016446 [Chloebia gouldiae]
MDFSPAQVQLRWLQSGREFRGHLVPPTWSPTGTRPTSSWCCWRPLPHGGVTSSCQVEHLSLEHPLSWHWVPLHPTSAL